MLTVVIDWLACIAWFRQHTSLELVSVSHFLRVHSGRWLLHSFQYSSSCFPNLFKGSETRRYLRSTLHHMMSASACHVSILEGGGSTLSSSSRLRTLSLSFINSDQVWTCYVEAANRPFLKRGFLRWRQRLTLLGVKVSGLAILHIVSRAWVVSTATRPRSHTAHSCALQLLSWRICEDTYCVSISAGSLWNLVRCKSTWTQRTVWRLLRFLLIVVAYIIILSWMQVLVINSLF